MSLFHFFALAVLGSLFPAVQAQSSASLVAQTPECALPCVLAAFQDGNCTVTTVQALETCICTNIMLQSELSTCVQLSCAFDDQVRAATLEAELCKAYPKESRSHSVMLAATISLAITLPIIALRMWARLKFTNRLWMDDYMTIVATVCIVALAGIEIASANMGFGMHYWNVDIDKGTTLLQLFYVVQMLYILIQVFAKVAILLLFARIFTAKWFQRAVKIFTIFLFGHGSIFLFLIIFQCIPVYSIWDRSVPRKCLNVTDIGWAGGVFSIVEDLVILVLPMPEARRLPLNTRKKVALLFMFSIGSFACVTSMVRLRYLVMFSKTFDTTWDNVDIVVWSIIELFAAMICGSLPAIRPLLVHFAPRLLGSVTRMPGKNTDNSATWSSKRRSNLRDDKFRPLPDPPPSDVIPEGDFESQRHIGDKEGVVDSSRQSVKPVKTQEDLEMQRFANQRLRLP